MLRQSLFLWLGVVLSLAAAIVLGIYFFRHVDEGQAPKNNREDTYETEHTDYTPPPADAELTDDQFNAAKRPAFDAALVDRRPLDKDGHWLLNSSAAMIGLDVPIIKPDIEGDLLTLYPSYAAAIQSRKHENILPSVNLIDGKAKQFDDGLYAALDRAYYQGLEGKLPSHVQLIKRIAEKAGKNNPAAAYLAAGLELAGVPITVTDVAAKERWLARFRNDQAASNPIGFYTWNDELSTLFRFMRFFQHKFDEWTADELVIPQALAAILEQDKSLKADYGKAIVFYDRLTNPSICLSLIDVRGVNPLDISALHRLAKEKHQHKGAVAFFPPSTSKEVVLFEKLFPQGLPPNVDLMKELVRRIRSGEVDLAPQAGSGWYEYQVYALETMLLPEKGQEKDKLLLSRTYKKRMLEAFKALVTKRRETHVRQLDYANAKTAQPPGFEDKVQPRLRIEPSATYYLRTARAYAFLMNFLEASIGKEQLHELHGLKKDGQRAADLHTELL